jgi:hypothetical protein
MRIASKYTSASVSESTMRTVRRETAIYSGWGDMESCPVVHLESEKLKWAS